MTDVSPAAGRGEDLLLDYGADAQRSASKFVAVDLRDGRFGVFIVHRNSREWWRLVAVFSTWARADKYAALENDCWDCLDQERPPHPDVAALWDESNTPAPDTLPPEPEPAATSELLAPIRRRPILYRSKPKSQNLCQHRSHPQKQSL